jgi:hypothetical protein
MRKILLPFCVFAIIFLTFSLTSCKKEDKSCTCTETDLEDGDTYTETIFPSNYNVKTCDELGSSLSGSGYSVKCKKSK